MTRLTLLLILFAACSSQPKKHILQAKANGTLAGTVHFIGAACETPGPGCDGPIADYEVIVLAKDGTTVIATTKTDAIGAYTISVPSGEYTILTPAGTTEKARNDVTVTSSTTAKLDLKIDTGVRSAPMGPE